MGKLDPKEQSERRRQLFLPSRDVLNISVRLGAIIYLRVFPQRLLLYESKTFSTFPQNQNSHLAERRSSYLCLGFLLSLLKGNSLIISAFRIDFIQKISLKNIPFVKSKFSNLTQLNSVNSLTQMIFCKVRPECLYHFSAKDMKLFFPFFFLTFFSSTLK